LRIEATAAGSLRETVGLRQTAATPLGRLLITVDPKHGEWLLEIPAASTPYGTG
jgi:hypothetical protein